MGGLTDERPPRTASQLRRGHLTKPEAPVSKRPARRRGRWTYNSDSSYYGEAGWHLDGTPVVIDFMPGYTDCAPGRGMYLLYNFPGRADEPLSTHVDEAMREVEKMWDEHLLKVLAGTVPGTDDKED